MAVIVPVITVDGPSGAGKGTLCQALAKAFGWHLLDDSGAIYRVLALAALHHHVDITSEDALVPLAANLDIARFIRDNGLSVILEGEDVSTEIRTETLATQRHKQQRFSRKRSIITPSSVHSYCTGINC